MNEDTQHVGFAVLGVALGLIALPSSADDVGSTNFNEHIAPIIYENCTECHRPGQAAPFSLLSYEDAARRASLIARVTESGYMPPWKVEPGYGEFMNERRLEADEIESFQAWVDSGFPEGPAEHAPTPPTFESDWYLGEPDVVVQMPEPFNIPAEGPDIYINFVVSLDEIPEGKYLRALEFRTQALTTAHHTLFALDDTGSARALDEQYEGPGYRSMGQSLRSNRIGGWAVGNLPMPYPEGVAISLSPGADLVLECHFHPSGKPEREQAEVALYLTDEPPTRQMVALPVPFAFGIAEGIDIPASEAAYNVEESFTIPVDVDVIDINPHAHYIAKEMQSRAVLPDGTTRELIWITDWDFAWQEQYRYAEPVRLPAGTRIDTRFVYDNSADNPRNPHNPPERVTFGPESTDEMASLSMSVIPVESGDTDVLKQAVKDYARDSIAQADIDLLWPVIRKQLYDRLDTDQDGRISMQELRAARGANGLDAEGMEMFSPLRDEIRRRLVLEVGGNLLGAR